jgi:hypothetical protein
MNQSPKFFYIFTCRGKYKKKKNNKNSDETSPPCVSSHCSIPLGRPAARGAGCWLAAHCVPSVPSGPVISNEANMKLLQTFSFDTVPQQKLCTTKANKEERVRTMHGLGLKTRKKKNQRTIAAINCNHALKDERYLSAPCRSDVCFAACFEKFGIENQKGIKTSASERSERRQKRKRTHQQFVAALLIHQARCFDLWHRGIFKARDSRFYFTVNSFFLSYFSYLAFSLLCVPFSIN